MKYDVSGINQYLEVLPPERKVIIERLIALLKEYHPTIKGNMKYNMPTFDPVCAMASQKNYISLYIHHPELIEKYRTNLGSLKVGKSCIRFKTLNEMPEQTIRNIFLELKL